MSSWAYLCVQHEQLGLPIHTTYSYGYSYSYSYSYGYGYGYGYGYASRT